MWPIVLSVLKGPLVKIMRMHKNPYLKSIFLCVQWLCWGAPELIFMVQVWSVIWWWWGVGRFVGKTCNLKRIPFIGFDFYLFPLSFYLFRLFFWPSVLTPHSNTLPPFVLLPAASCFLPLLPPPVTLLPPPSLSQLSAFLCCWARSLLAKLQNSYLIPGARNVYLCQEQKHKIRKAVGT